MASPRVELYTTPFCALCERTRQLLERAAIAFTEIDLQIVIDGRPIGGIDELTALQRNGRLADYTSEESTVIESTDG